MEKNMETSIKLGRGIQELHHLSLLLQVLFNFPSALVMRMIKSISSTLKHTPLEPYSSFHSLFHSANSTPIQP